MRLLSLSGWEVVVTTPFAGGIVDAPPGVLVIASRGPLELRHVGATVADVATGVFTEAMRLEGRYSGAAA